jgi:hypothetical protein
VIEKEAFSKPPVVSVVVGYHNSEGCSIGFKCPLGE